MTRLSLLLIALGGCGLAIEPESVATQSEPDGRFFFVIEAGDPFVVLTTDASEAWGAGFAERIAPDTLAMEVSPDAIPVEWSGLARRTFVAYGTEGELCTAPLGELAIVRRYDMGWELGDEDPDDPEVIDEAWERAGEEGSTMLTARLDARGVECDMAFWGHLSGAAPAAMLLPVHDEEAASDVQAALAALRSGAEYAEIEAAWIEYRKEELQYDPELPERWDEAYAIDARVLADPESGDRVVLLQVQGDACGGFSADVAHIYDVAGGDVELRWEGSTWPWTNAIVDLEGDGRLERVIGLEELVPLDPDVTQLDADGYEIPLLDVTYPMFSCPC